MPPTPLHWALVWPLVRFWPRRFDAIGLSLGAVILDVDKAWILVVLLTRGPSAALETFSGRWLSHSLLIGGLLGILVGFALVRWVVPPLLRLLKEKVADPRWHHFASQDLTSQPPWYVTMWSVAIGVLSHLVLDLINHSANPILWPGPDLPGLGQPWVQVVAYVILGFLTFWMLFAWWAFQPLPGPAPDGPSSPKS